MDENLFVGWRKRTLRYGLRERERCDARIGLVDNRRGAGYEALQGEAVVLGSHDDERFLVAHAQGMRVRSHVPFVAAVERADELMLVEVPDLDERYAACVEQFENVIVLQVQRFDVLDERASSIRYLGVFGENALKLILGDVLPEVGVVGLEPAAVRTNPRVGYFGSHAACLEGVGIVVEEVELSLEDAVPK